MDKSNRGQITTKKMEFMNFIADLTLCITYFFAKIHTCIIDGEQSLI